jgi:succinoglycan biosynthesis transport protein ExoP
MLSGADDGVKTLQITSSVPEEGKSTLALSFARVLARSGKKVVLVDADLRRASLEKKMGIDPLSTGLTDLVLADEGANIEDFSIIDEKSGALFIPKGGAEYVNASDVLSSHRMEGIIASLKQQFDYVIFDTPPIMAVSDARLLGRLVDKTLFVVHWDKTPKKVVKAALQQLNHAQIDVAGCVLQKVDLKRYGSYGYGDSGYYYHYGKYGQYYSG